MLRLSRSYAIASFRLYALNATSLSNCPRVLGGRVLDALNTRRRNFRLCRDFSSGQDSGNIDNKILSQHSKDVEYDIATRAVTEKEIDEELLRYDYEDFELLPDEPVTEVTRKPLPISLDRGKTGVFDVEDLVSLLEDENGQDICVLPVPKEYNYVDYLVVVTGRSTRHLRAMAEFIRWMYKQRRSKSDPNSVKIEGVLCKDWMAIDLGNIAVHLFLSDTRQHYNLESLWTVERLQETSSDSIDIDIDSRWIGASQREDFSFDIELERLRQLRHKKTVTTEQDSSNNINSRSMENIAGWHEHS